MKAMKWKGTCSWKKSYDQPRKHIKKQRHYFVDRGPSSQSCGSSRSHVLIWELDHKESWVTKNWCLWTMVLKKTLESSPDCKEIQSVNPKGNQSWIFIRRTDTEAEAPILWPPDSKKWLIGNALVLGKIEGRRRRGQQKICWMASLARWTWVWARSQIFDDGLPWEHSRSCLV